LENSFISTNGIFPTFHNFIHPNNNNNNNNSLKRENFEIFNIPEHNNIISVQKMPKYYAAFIVFGAKSRKNFKNLFIHLFFQRNLPHLDSF
jgi:hypothetical protein